MASISRTYKLDKLSNTNYRIWSIKMQMLLIRAETWDVVNGTNVDPGADPTVAAQHAAWLLSDSKARSDIILNCGDLQIQLIHLLPSAKAMWDTLKASYDHVDVATQIHTQKRLVTMQMQEEDRVPDFLDRWQSVLDDTVSAGLVIPALQQVTLLLTALPSSWRSFVTTQSSLAGLTLPALIGKILPEDAMRNTTVSRDAFAPSALYVAGRGARGGRRGGGGEPF